MKAVAFICLLSLSLCLSLPQSNQASPPAESKPDPTGNPVKETPPPTVHEEAQKPVNLTANNTTTDIPPKHVETSKLPINDTQKQNATNISETVTKSPTKQDNTTNALPAKDDKDKKDVKPTEKATEASNSTSPTAATTIKPATEKSTENPKDTKEVPLVTARGFDGPSFIGGIILTLGLLAIGFMGFKYYKNQTERNYHTL